MVLEVRTRKVLGLKSEGYCAISSDGYAHELVVRQGTMDEEPAGPEGVGHLTGISFLTRGTDGKC